MAKKRKKKKKFIKKRKRRFKKVKRKKSISKKRKKKLKKIKRKKSFSKKPKNIKKKSSKQTTDADGNIVFKVSENWAKQAYANKAKYEKKYKQSIKNNDDFWRKEGKRISWIKPPKIIE